MRLPFEFGPDGLPWFYADVPTITLRDGLAATLGAARDGLLTYGYADAVRLAGHSCPTVAGAYLMTLRGLQALYGDEVPRRGEMEVLMSQERDSGTTGVIGSIATLITGAANELGFGGLGGHLHRRRHLLSYGGRFDGVMAIKRRDSGQVAQLSYRPDVVPFEGAAELQSLLPLVINGTADERQRRRFGQLWQWRVCLILTEGRDHPDLVSVQRFQD